MAEKKTVEKSAPAKGSVGLVETRIARIDLPEEGFRLENGGVLTELDVAYETYGTLSPTRDNVIFICHALSGDAHVAGFHGEDDEKPGWWDEMVGPGKGIDTNYYYVICANILGGCKGTTGPSSVNPGTGKPYGSTFPKITVGDIVDVDCLLLKHLGIDKVAAIIGGSFGGMQVLEWAIRYPDTVERCVCVASASSMSAQALAFDVVGRGVITSDPDWQGGDYYGTGRAPVQGLAHARKIGHITYLSPEMMTEKFGRERRAGVDRPAGESFLSDFQVESYLAHQGERFVARFDANSYLHITRAMDEFDLAERFGSLEEAFRPVQAKILVVALSADWLFTPEQSIAMANALLRAGKRVSYCILHAPHGHDAFLVDIEHMSDVMRAFLPWVTPPERPRTGSGKAGASYGRAGAGSRSPAASEREYRAIGKIIHPNATVLDLGCGGGELLSMLRDEIQVRGFGVDINLDHVIRVLDRGHDIFQGDIDAGLAMIPNDAYEYAVLSETLQVVRKPRFVLREMLRVAKEGIVSFPNFGKWQHRLRIALGGRMPKGGALPFEWYDTPNIHLFTLSDFVDVCRKDKIRILDVVSIPDSRLSDLALRLGLRGMGADRLLARITKGQ